MKLQTLRFLLATGCLLAAQSAPGADLQLSTTFTYAGRLDDGGRPAEGIMDFEFQMWSAREGGELLGTLSRFGRPVEGGTFAEELDFGPAIHAADQAWLEIHVRGADDSTFTTLSPRQPVNGGGSTCTVAGDAIVEGRLAVGTDGFLGTASRIEGPEATANGVSGSLLVSNGLGYLMMDGDEIDSWFIGPNPAPLHLGANSQAGVSIGTLENEAPLHVGAVDDAAPDHGGVLVLGHVDGANLALDGNEVMARNNGGTAPLFINHDGGNVVFHGGSGVGDVVIGGTLDLRIETYVGDNCIGPGVVNSPSCPTGTYPVSGGCFTLNDRDLQYSYAVGGKWACGYTSCGDPGALEAHVLCLGIK